MLLLNELALLILVSTFSSVVLVVIPSAAVVSVRVRATVCL